MDILLYALSLIPFYILGVFPSGVLVAKLQGVDIRSTGSGNVGATNVARTLGKKAGLITLLCDVGKGALAVSAASLISNDLNYQALAGFIAVLGHCLSFPPKLTGGKGVATALGVIVAMSPLLAVITLGLFTTSAIITKVVSLSSLIAALGAPIAALLLDLPTAFQLSLVGCALIIAVRHKANIQRIVRGEEKKFSFGSSEDAG